MPSDRNWSRIPALLTLLAIAGSSASQARANVWHTSARSDLGSSGDSFISGSINDADEVIMIALVGGLPQLRRGSALLRGGAANVQLVSPRTAPPVVQNDGTVIWWERNTTTGHTSILSRDFRSAGLVTTLFTTNATAITALDCPVRGPRALATVDPGTGPIPGVWSQAAIFIADSDPGFDRTSIVTVSGPSGTGSAPFHSFESNMSDGGRGIFRFDNGPAQSFSLVARTGAIYPSLSGSDINKSGQVAFWATVASLNNDAAIVRGEPGGSTTILAAAGPIFEQLSAQRPVIGDGGTVFFRAKLSAEAAGVPGGVEGIFACDGRTTCEVLRIGDDVQTQIGSVFPIKLVTGLLASNSQDHALIAVTVDIDLTHTAVVASQNGNSAPVLDTSTALALDPVAVNGVGDMLVAAVLDSRSPFHPITDSDNDPRGIAIVAAEHADGFEYTLDGSNYRALGVVTSSTALLLPANGLARLRFTPETDFQGTAAITFRAWDLSSGLPGMRVDTADHGAGFAFSAVTSTMTVTVAPPNTAPTFTAGLDVTVLEDAGAQTISGWATAISAGPASEAGQTVTFTVSAASPALFTVAPAVASNGTLTFTPAADANGSTTVTITARDDGGAPGEDTSAVKSFTITITPVNDAPGFTKGADVTVLEDAGAQSISGWATAITKGPANEASQAVTFSVTASAAGLFSAAPALAADGTLTFTPAAQANGVATVTVTASDDGGTASGGVDTSAPQTFTITITPVNDAPGFTKGADVTVLEDAGAQSISGWASAITKGPANEAAQVVTFSVTASAVGLFSAGPAVAADGTLTFTPAAQANGVATVTVTALDDGGTASGGVDASAPQTFTITLTPVNDAPEFTRGADVSVLEDSAGATIPGWATALSKGPADEAAQALSFQAVASVSSLFSAGPDVAADGTLTFTPADDANGIATVTVTAHDDGGTASGGIDASAAQTFTITITPVNDAPGFTKGVDVAVEDRAGPQTITGWATAISRGPADEAGQSVTFTVTTDAPGLFSAQPEVADDGTLRFTPKPGTSGAATVTVTARDDGGTANGGEDMSAPQTFAIRTTRRGGGGSGGGCSIDASGGDRASAGPMAALLLALILTRRMMRR